MEPIFFLFRDLLCSHFFLRCHFRFLRCRVALENKKKAKPRKRKNYDNLWRNQQQLIICWWTVVFAMPCRIQKRTVLIYSWVFRMRLCLSYMQYSPKQYVTVMQTKQNSWKCKKSPSLVVCNIFFKLTKSIPDNRFSHFPSTDWVMTECWAAYRIHWKHAAKDTLNGSGISSTFSILH